MNTVGELVITQSMLTQLGTKLDGQRRRAGARRPGAAGAQRARAAGKRHARAHAADQLRIQPLSAHGPRPEPAARQAGRAEGDRRPDRARQDGAGEDRRSARAPGAQQRRPRHRDAAGAGRGRQVGGRRRLAGGLSQGRQHRRGSLRRRRRLAARAHPREGARARPGRRERHARPKSRSTISSSWLASPPPTRRPTSRGAASAWTSCDGTSRSWAAASKCARPTDAALASSSRCR